MPMMLPTKVLLLDIETTGLSREKDAIISIGIMYLNAQQKIESTYWFLESLDQEADLLKRFLDFIVSYDAVFTYYGKRFEFPFLLSRLQHYQLDSASFLRLKLIDMRMALKHFSKNRLELEKHLGFKRQCQSTGADIVKLFQTYLACHVEIYKTCILEHQKEELESLSYFFELYMTLYDTKKWVLLAQEVQKTHYLLSIQVPNVFRASFSAAAFNMKFDYKACHSILRIQIPLYTGTLLHDMEPVKDYYYIEAQHQIMHKSVAQFIPSTLKRKATKEECVIAKESTYLKLATSYKLSAALWHDDKHNFYMELADFSLDTLLVQLFYVFFQQTK